MAPMQQTNDNRPAMYILAIICFDRLKIMDSAALIPDNRNESIVFGTGDVKLDIGGKFEKTCTADSQCTFGDPNSFCKPNLSSKNKSCSCTPHYQFEDGICKHRGSTSITGLSPAAEKTAIISGCVAGVAACCGIAVVVYISRWRSSRRKDKREWIRTQVGQIVVE